MEVKDALFNFNLDKSSMVYITREGTTSKRLDDGTIMRMPKYMYHRLTMEVLPRTDYKTIMHPKRKFEFTLREVRDVPEEVANLVTNPDPSGTEKTLSIIKKRIKEIISNPFRTKGVIAFRHFKMSWKVILAKWDKEGILEYYENREWKKGPPPLEPERKEELVYIIDKLRQEKDIPYVSRLLLNSFY
jgi:hypothetical protein